MIPGVSFTGYVYAAIGQRAEERGYLKIGYAADPEHHYRTTRDTPFRTIVMIQPDSLRRPRGHSHLPAGVVAEAVLDVFRSGHDMLYDGRAFPPGYAELVKFDAAHRDRLKKRLARGQRRLNPDAARFLRALLTLWDAAMPAEPWLAGIPLPEMHLVPPSPGDGRRPAAAADRSLAL